MEYTLSNGLIAALAIELVFVVALPIALLVRWCRRSHANLLPAVVGMVVFIVFAQMLEQILHYACLLSNNPLSRAITGNPWLYALYGGVAAALFEETGRFMGFKYLLRRHPERETAITYGLGHGGYECLALAGLATLSYLVLALFIQSGAVPALMENFNETEAAAVQEVLSQVAAITPSACLWGAVERAAALALHVSLSVLVFASVWQPERGSLYLAAMGLHLAANFPAGLYQAGLLSGPRGMAAAELLTIAVSVAAALLARRVWRQLPPTEEKISMP